jgi:hypothetical protein
MKDTIRFYHRVGHILDEERRMVSLEPDSPGWYFWGDDFDGSRRLHGPYDSEEDVNEAMEYLA